VTNQKLDPYINVDPGTMSPFQHGEVFVTDDGAETDLDLGHYERFTGCNANKQAPSSPPGRSSWTAPSAWSKWPWHGWTVKGSSPSTRTARPRWCPTCWSCSAATSGPPRS